MNTLDERFFTFTPVFRMGGGRKTFTIAMFAISIVLNLVDIASATDYYIIDFTATLRFFIFLLTALAFLLWFHRVYNNLPLLGAEGLRYTPGWTDGGFIIPFLSFVIPYLMMKEVWKASSPTDYGFCKSADWKNAPVTFVVLGWWAFFLNAIFLALIAFSMVRAQASSLTKAMEVAIELQIFFLY